MDSWLRPEFSRRRLSVSASSHDMDDKSLVSLLVSMMKLSGKSELETTIHVWEYMYMPTWKLVRYVGACWRLSRGEYSMMSRSMAHVRGSMAAWVLAVALVLASLALAVVPSAAWAETEYSTDVHQPISITYEAISGVGTMPEFTWNQAMSPLRQ